MSWDIYLIRQRRIVHDMWPGNCPATKQQAEYFCATLGSSEIGLINQLKNKLNKQSHVLHEHSETISCGSDEFNFVSLPRKHYSATDNTAQHDYTSLPLNKENFTGLVSCICTMKVKFCFHHQNAINSENLWIHIEWYCPCTI
jgi:hypothetical protein